MTFDKYCAHKVQERMEEIIAALTLENAVLESAVESVESPTEDSENKNRGSESTEVFRTVGSSMQMRSLSQWTWRLRGSMLRRSGRQLT